MKALSLVLLLAWLPGCRGFKEIVADATPDLPPADLSVANDRVQDSKTDSVGPLPNDFKCLEPWTKTNKTDSSCVPRQVKSIAAGILMPHDVSIARTPQGRIGILYNKMLSSDEGNLQLAYFAFDQGNVTIKEITGDAFEKVGVASSIAADASGVIHFAYLTATSFSNEIFYRRLLVNEQLSPEEAAVTNFSPAGELSLVINGSGNATLAYFNSSAGEIKSKRRSSASTAWSDPALVIEGLDTSMLGGGGQLDLILDSNDLPRIAYHCSITDTLSNPRYAAFDGANWILSKTLDNTPPTGTAGWSIGLARNAKEQLFASYYSTVGNILELRLASWSSNNDSPQIAVLSQMSMEDLRFKRPAAALAIDRHGLLHIVSLSRNGTDFSINYSRQYPIGGQLKWLVDTIDDQAFTTTIPALVDIVVDSQDRPHIAYYNSTTNKVFYATRLDR